MSQTETHRGKIIPTLEKEGETQKEYFERAFGDELPTLENSMVYSNKEIEEVIGDTLTIMICTRVLSSTQQTLHNRE